MKSKQFFFRCILLSEIMFGLNAISSSAGNRELLELNEAFLSAYDKETSLIVNQSGPILVVSDDYFTLIKNGKTETYKLNMELFHSLKSIAHIPLTISLLMRNSINLSKLSVDTIESLTRIKTPLLASKGGVHDFPTEPPSVRNGVLEVIEQSLHFIDASIANNTVTKGQLFEYTRTVFGSVKVNLSDAVLHQKNQIARQMENIKAQLNETEFKNLKVVVLGVLQIREKNLFLGYFKDYLNIKQEDRAKLIFAENILNVEAGVKLLGKVLLDREIGSLFKGDSLGLEHDLRADVSP